MAQFAQLGVQGRHAHMAVKHIWCKGTIDLKIRQLSINRRFDSTSVRNISTDVLLCRTRKQPMCISLISKCYGQRMSSSLTSSPSSSISSSNGHNKTNQNISQQSSPITRQQNITEEEFKEVLSSSAESRRRWTSVLPWILGTGMFAMILAYGTYKVSVCQDVIFIPYWIKEYEFEELLTPEHKFQLTGMAVNAMIESLAYKESVVGMLGLPIIIESVDEIRFFFPEDSPAEHVLKGFEVSHEPNSGIMPTIRKSARIFSIRDVQSKLLAPLASATGLGSTESEDETGVQELFDSFEQTKIWVKVAGTVTVQGARIRRQSANSSQHCVIKFEGFMDSERLNTVTIRGGVIEFYENDKLIREVNW
ncbi:hypothetical protein V1511DRAFT_501352 [Dipodascopsis uninucleata]